MSDFEKWFVAQDFYTNMRFIHGDALFHKDSDVYRILPVQMTYLAWSEQRQRTKDKFVSITQEWHTKGWDARQEEVGELKAEIKKLRNLVGQAGCGMDAYQEGINQLKTQLAVYKEDMQKDAEKIGGLQKRIDGVSQVLCELKESMDGFKEMDLYDKGYRVTTEYVISDLEQALRGES